MSQAPEDSRFLLLRYATVGALAVVEGTIAALEIPGPFVTDFIVWCIFAVITYFIIEGIVASLEADYLRAMRMYQITRNINEPPEWYRWIHRIVPAVGFALGLFVIVALFRLLPFDTPKTIEYPVCIAVGFAVAKLAYYFATSVEDDEINRRNYGDHLRRGGGDF